jgi:Ca2+-binding RTX toxin-like protein
VAYDTIRLKRTVFSKLAAGELSDEAFWMGSKAHDRDDRIVYSKATGSLLYDADGSGSGAAVKFAVLARHLKMSADDFVAI